MKLRNGELVNMHAENAIDLSHLLLSAQKIALLPNAERIIKVRSNRWIGYTRACQALEKLEDLLSCPNRQRMQNMLLIGPTNNGKSMIIERFYKKHMRYTSEDQTQEIIPVLVMQMPSDPSIGRFYTMLLYALGVPAIGQKMRLSDIEMLALRLMRITNVQMLIIDELHNMLAGGSKVRSEFLNLLRFLGNELRIPIIGVGTEDAYRAVRTDDQLENRFNPFILSRWKDDEEFLMLLASFEASMPLRKQSHLYNEDMARYIISRTEGTIGKIATLLTRTAIVAINSGAESMNAKTFSQADYEGPTVRRRRFEREIV